MRKMTIIIETGNDAFEPDPSVELARILKKLAKGLEVSFAPAVIQDINGNPVGKIEVD